MKIWKTEEEAKITTCFKQQRPVGGEYDFHPCLGSECGHWLPRPCPVCKGSGYAMADIHVQCICQECNGTGHDNSNLGRCGMVNL
jgi:hypothetical protein